MITQTLKQLFFGDILGLDRCTEEHMPEDPQKIQRKIEELNASTPGMFWGVVKGNHALTGMVVDPKGTATFLPTRGIPLKAFFNKSTGEIKIFPARMFEKNK